MRVEPGDVAATLRSSARAFDAILLDVDNGPAAFATSGNAALYNDAGLAAARAALKNGGVLAVWSAREDRKFEQRLRYAGFRVEVERVRARLKKGGPRHTIFIGSAIVSDPIVPQPRRPAAGLVTFLVHAIVFVILAWWSWRKWPDPLIDFGRELYVPWQITQGAVLYRDIASLFGPLSPYVNALWFRLFGVSFTTLIFCNLAIFAAMLAGLYHLVRLSTDTLVATLVTLSVMLLFGFSQYVEIGNYNFVTPYSHETTHGLALSVAMVVALHQGFVRRRLTPFAIAGLCFGGVLLTKAGNLARGGRGGGRGTCGRADG